MGTNYYLHYDVCPHCNRPSKVEHIGKSSCGWCFSLHVIKDEGDEDILSLDDWRKEWNKPGNIIFDEYNRMISPAEMEKIITIRKARDEIDEKFMEENQAVPGPNNMARSMIDGLHCIGHGEGTWDLIRGNFS